MIPDKPKMFMLAPMAELSHRALRELIIEFEGESLPPNSSPGLNAVSSVTPFECEQNPPKIIYFTEMISAGGLLSGGPLEKYYLDNGPCPERLVYQLVGADETQLARAAALLDRQESLGIDLNMGCAAPAITRTGAGVRWMEDSEKAARLVEQIRRLTKKQLSAKIRLGPKNFGSRKQAAAGQAAAQNAVDSAEPAADSGVLPDFPYLLRFCRRLQEAGLDMITLHPRQAAEKFKRRARWDYVTALRAELTIPVAGNGDIDSAAELAQKAESGPVMAGRLLVREPWAFAGAANLSAASSNPAAAPPPSSYHSPRHIEETGLRFLELLALYQPPEFHLSRARRFFRYYCGNLTWAEYTRNQINREETLSGIEKVWRAYFRTCP